MTPTELILKLEDALCTMRLCKADPLLRRCGLLYEFRPRLQSISDQVDRLTDDMIAIHTLDDPKLPKELEPGFDANGSPVP